MRDFGPIPGEPVPTSLALDELADHVDAEALTLGEPIPAVGPLGIARLTFSRGHTDAVNEVLASTVLVGSPDGLRRMGDLLRDACYLAAERAR